MRTFLNENDTLADIVNSLPNLLSLDISGTNLAGTGEITGFPNVYSGKVISEVDNLLT